jgi:hypothetical protein
MMAMPVKDAWFARSGFGIAPISDIGWGVTIAFLGLPFVAFSLADDLHTSEAEGKLLAGLWLFAFWIAARYKSCTREEYQKALKDAGVQRRGLWGGF